MINFVDKFHEALEKFSLYQGEGLMVMNFKKNLSRHDAALLTIPYLKVPLIVWFHKTFKLIILKQPSCPKNRELAMIPFLGISFILF